MSGGIFISYRRQETGGDAGRLFDQLANRFGEGRVFMDVDAIAPGVDFGEAINEAVGTCKVLLAVIGPHWLTITGQDGHRRLDNPEDIVRLEVEAALKRDVRVIPILVGGAVMPQQHELPESLGPLARRNGLSVRHESFRSDVARLVAAIDAEPAMSRPARTERPGRRRIPPPGRPRLALLLALALGLAAVAVGVTYVRNRAESPAATTAATGPTQTTRPPSTTSFAVGGESWKGTKTFEDQFSNRKAGWETVDNATHTLGYKNGAYEITAKQAGNHVAFPAADPALSSPNDVAIGVRARRLTGTSGNGYGITFRYKDSRNYYWFNITNEGGRSLTKRMNGNRVRVVWPKDTDGVISPTGLNHIQVMCTEGSGGSARLVVWVNGTQLVDYTDPDSLEPGGRVGLFGYNAGEGPSRWTYDDFSVWELRG